MILYVRRLIKKVLLTCSILLLAALALPRPCLAQAGADLSLTNFRWSRYVRALNDEPEWNESPKERARYEREKATNEKNYGDLIRSHELKKLETEAARSSVRPEEIFVYKVKVQNMSMKTTKALFWEYQIIESASPENVTRREFFCATQIKSNDGKDLEVYSGAPPAAKVISAKTLGGESRKPFVEKVIINRIEYSDGSSWQRTDWSFPTPEAATLSTAKRDIHEPVCRGL
jgi:hypothetical protein